MQDERDPAGVRYIEESAAAASSREAAREMLRGIDVGVLHIDEQMIVCGCTADMDKLFGVGIRSGAKVSDIAHSLGKRDFIEQVEGAITKGRPIGQVASRPETDQLFLIRVLPYNLAQSHGAAVAFVDISESIEAHKQQRALLTELNHRVRNMLQVVMGLCNQLLHRSNDLAEFQGAFTGRLQGLARTYDLLARERWSGIRLADLIQLHLSAFAHSSRFSLQGEPVMLRADAALALGLSLYELCANAANYGALSNDAGHVTVKWGFEASAHSAHAHELVLTWRERGGPLVVPPTRRGFGCELIERQLRHALGGEVRLIFSDCGVEVTLRIPGKDIVQIPS